MTIYWAAWAVAALLAAFPSVVLDFTLPFASETLDLPAMMRMLAIPLVAFMVAFTIDVAYTISTCSMRQRRMRLGLVYTVVLMAVSMLFATLSIYYTCETLRVTFFWLSFVCIISIKFVSLWLTAKESVKLTKPKKRKQ